MWNVSEYIPYAFALIVAIPFFVLLKQFVYTYVSLKERELKTIGIKVGNENRFQSFERMVLFLERIKPANLVNRFDKELIPHEFVYLTTKNIREEFDYNASQQIYISKVNWINIISSKDDIIKLLHSTNEGLKESANLDEFKTLFLMNYIEGGDFISDTIEELKKELLIINYNT